MKLNHAAKKCHTVSASGHNARKKGQHKVSSAKKIQGKSIMEIKRDGGGGKKTNQKVNRAVYFAFSVIFTDSMAALGIYRLAKNHVLLLSQLAIWT